MRLRNLVFGAVTLTTVLAGCSTVLEPSVPTAATSPSPEPTEAHPQVTSPVQTTSTDPLDGYVDLGNGSRIPPGGPGDCIGSAYIHIGSIGGKVITELLLPENLVDMGPRKFAEGEVDYDVQGRVATYTVAAGDVDAVIGERFCIYNGLMIGSLNGHEDYQWIQPGEVLVLNPQAVTE